MVTNIVILLKMLVVVAEHTMIMTATRMVMAPNPHNQGRYCRLRVRAMSVYAGQASVV